MTVSICEMDARFRFPVEACLPGGGLSLRCLMINGDLLR